MEGIPPRINVDWESVVSVIFFCQEGDIREDSPVRKMVARISKLASMQPGLSIGVFYDRLGVGVNKKSPTHARKAFWIEHIPATTILYQLVSIAKQASPPWSRSAPKSPKSR